MIHDLFSNHDSICEKSIIRLQSRPDAEQPKALNYLQNCSGKGLKWQRQIYVIVAYALWFKLKAKKGITCWGKAKFITLKGKLKKILKTVSLLSLEGKFFHHFYLLEAACFSWKPWSISILKCHFFRSIISKWYCPLGTWSDNGCAEVVSE